MRCASHVKITSGKQQFVIEEYFPQQIVTLFTILDSNVFFLILLDNKKVCHEKKIKQLAFFLFFLEMIFTG